MAEQSKKRLVTEAGVVEMLSLEIGDLDWLEATGQLSPLCIHGKRLFDAQEVEQLIDLLPAMFPMSRQHKDLWRR